MTNINYEKPEGLKNIVTIICVPVFQVCYSLHVDREMFIVNSVFECSNIVVIHLYFLVCKTNRVLLTY